MYVLAHTHVFLRGCCGIGKESRYYEVPSHFLAVPLVILNFVTTHLITPCQASQHLGLHLLFYSEETVRSHTEVVVEIALLCAQL